MSQQTPNEKYMDTPEEFMILPASERFPIDSINCAKTRASAILNMLINEFGVNHGNQLSPNTVANDLWAIEGYLNQIEVMVNHSYQTLHPHIYDKK